MFAATSAFSDSAGRASGARFPLTYSTAPWQGYGKAAVISAELGTRNHAITSIVKWRLLTKPLGKIASNSTLSAPV